ncbi:MAG TPA: replicative DNA helicase [Bacteroidales bacterium]|jgi:replicative DNA helicase|nr:replicative DNA helicase [Bacteroidales bacterium]HNY75350.1 replicative DNA helicase [Bacteroidales bacterium]HOC40023.1 replicative DNA helicase [Bacteroidales bacterium]HOF06919.1 replicative DNA helicase [Bacteroidales bacterium]HOH93226.1 replicative DNA helicase [Bacteroidales bacterium]
MAEEKKTTTKKTTQSSSKTKKIESIEIIGGKIPPSDLETEEVVLGAILIEPNALATVIDILQPEVFYKEAHQRIFAAVLALYPIGEPIDVITVTNYLRKSGEIDFIGGPAYIAQLTDRVISAANIEYHARILIEKYIQRKLIEISNNIITEAYDATSDAFDTLNEAENALFQINEQNLRRSFRSMPSVLQVVREQIETAYKNQGEYTGVVSGFYQLDQLTGGLQPSDLIIIAARPGMGKTAFALSMARNMAVEFGFPIAFFSLEMTAPQLVIRILSAQTQISSERIRKGELDDTEWMTLNEAMNKLSNVKLFLDDTPALSIFELRAKARRLKQAYDIQAIYIDYLQLMTAKIDKNSNREQEIASISRSLKALAKELNIPVIALSQLSRDVEKRSGTKRPQLSDLRESGAIEQDADIVIGIYRPEYYMKEEQVDEDKLAAVKNKAEIILLKHRNGPLGTVNLYFLNQFALFTDEDISNINFEKQVFQSKINEDFDEDYYGSYEAPY